jgi:hypothetical protein
LNGSLFLLDARIAQDYDEDIQLFQSDLAYVALYYVNAIVQRNRLTKEQQEKDNFIGLLGQQSTRYFQAMDISGMRGQLEVMFVWSLCLIQVISSCLTNLWIDRTLAP